MVFATSKFLCLSHAGRWQDLNNDCIMRVQSAAPLLPSQTPKVKECTCVCSVLVRFQGGSTST